MKKYYCPACESKKSEEINTGLSVCSKCNHIFKSKEVLKSFYHTYLNSGHVTKDPQTIRRLKYINNYRLNFVKAFCPSGNLLEFGCGNKYFLEAAKKDFTVSGTELAEKMLKDLSKDYKMYDDTLCNLKNLEMYDVICGWNVFHLMNDPILELRTMGLHLNEGGVICLEFPMLNFITLDIEPNKFYKGEQTQYFNQISLNIVAKLAGLKIIYQQNYWDTDYISNTMICLVKEDTKIDDVRPKFWKHLSYGIDIGEYNE
jgi:hypothetical protein